MVHDRTGMVLAHIPAGRFLMGLPPTEEGLGSDETQHEVHITRPFWMAKHPVTNEQYDRFLAEQPTRPRLLGLFARPKTHRQKYWDDSKYNAPNQPVVGVSWADAVAYAKWAGMSLPTEAQWEYAARAGTTTRYWSGDSESDLAAVGWYSGNSFASLHAVGEKSANAWGLHDVHGNVWEWTADWYGDYPGSSQTDPTGPGSGSYRVGRGGCWGGDASSTRVANRSSNDPGFRFYVLGFRVSRTIP
jgi:formylglycine-generating enzyme required for sulfatase activity